MLIWSRWGILLVPIAVIGVFAASMIGAGLRSLTPDIAGQALVAETTGAFLVGGFIAGGLAWLLHSWQAGKPSRTLVDPNTGQQFEIRQTAGSLFFIPVRYWAFILPPVLALMGYSIATNPTI